MRHIDNLGDAASAIGQASRESNYLLLQNFEHRFTDAHRVVATKEVMQALSKAGNKHIVLELSNAEQNTLNSYYAGKITRKDFIVHMSANSNDYLSSKNQVRHGMDIADLVDNAKANGMKVHFVDTQQPDVVLRGARRYPTKNVGQIKEILSKSIADMQEAERTSDHLHTDYKLLAKDHIAALERLNSLGLKDSAPSSQIIASIKPFNVSRYDGDKRLSEDILRLTHGEKTAILYGSGHGNIRNGSGHKGQDLDEHLAQHGKVAKIGLTKNGWAPFITAEMPNTIVTVHHSFFGGHQKAEVREHDPKKPLGSEVSGRNPLSSIGGYKNVDPSQLGHLPPPAGAKHGHSLERK